MAKTDGERESLTMYDEYVRDRPLRARSRDHLETPEDDACTLKKEVDQIRLSLDVLKENLILQQHVLARDFETRIRHVYDDVVNDINGIRKQVNDIGDTFESETKFKTWTPLMPFRKDVLQSVYKIKSPQTSKLKGSKSVDFVDHRSGESDRTADLDFDKFHSKTLFSQRQSWLGSSQCSISSSCSSRRMVPGFGCCFSGDGKTIPYRSRRAWHHGYRSHRHSWGPSRSGSRSTLDEDEPDDRGCLCGVVSDDWRAKVVPYMWEGWPVPGIDKLDIGKLRDRMEQMETMRHEIVHVHNEYRRQHGCPELLVTTELAREAQQWSDILAMRGYAQYSDSQSRGENILVVDIEDGLSGRQVVDTWYRESRFYNYKNPRWQRGTSNFTQLIWQSSQIIGVGIAKFPYDNTYVIVAQYQPPGNVNTHGQFRRNVPVPIVIKNPEHKENDTTECDSLECELTHNTSECELIKTEHHRKLENDTSECDLTNDGSESKVTNKIPDDVSKAFADLKRGSHPSNNLLEKDEANILESQGTDYHLKQSVTSSSGRRASIESTQNTQTDSQTDDEEELSSGQNESDIYNLPASLTDLDNDETVNDSSEDEDSLEKSTVIASVSASRTSSLYGDAGQVINEEAIKNDSMIRDLNMSLEEVPDTNSKVNECTNSLKVTTV